MADAKLIPFTYVSRITTLAPGATASDTINIQADSEFNWVKTAFYASISNAGQTESSKVIPNVTVSITDTGSGRNYQDKAVNLQCMAGSEGLPYVNPIVNVFNPKATVVITYTNNSGSDTYSEISLALQGFKKLAY